MAPKPESSITRTSPSPSTSRTLIIPPPYKASLITGTTEARTYKPAHIPSRVLLLRLSRFQSSEAHGTIKIHTRVDIPTSVHVPCFSDPRQGEDCRKYPIPCGSLRPALRCHYTCRTLHRSGTSITFHPVLPHMLPHNGEQTTASPSNILEHRYRMTRFWDSRAILSCSAGRAQ